MKNGLAPTNEVSERALDDRDWPWVEMLAVWNLSYGSPPGDEMSGYSLVEPDLTPRPAYYALREMPK